MEKNLQSTKVTGPFVLLRELCAFFFFFATFSLLRIHKFMMWSRKTYLRCYLSVLINLEWMCIMLLYIASQILNCMTITLAYLDCISLIHSQALMSPHPTIKGWRNLRTYIIHECCVRRCISFLHTLVTNHIFGNLLLSLMFYTLVSSL